MKEINKKTVIITGASRGIGLATATLFAVEKYNIVICSRNKIELEQAKISVIKKTGNHNVLAISGDITQAEFVKTLFSQAYQMFKSIDVCVNNAGCLIVKPFAETTFNDWRYTMETNVTATFLCCKEAFHYMRDPVNNSVIINVSSLSGIRGVEKFPGMAAYIASKHAVIGLTESLAVEGKPFNINVNCIAPGAVNTKIFHECFADQQTTTQPEEIANIIKFLASENAGKMVNGTIFEYFCNE